MNIIVNDKKREWSDNKITFSQLVELEYSVSPNEADDIYSVRYRLDRSIPWESLKFSDPVEVKDDMEFHVFKNNES